MMQYVRKRALQKIQADTKNFQGAKYFQLQKVVWYCSETTLRDGIKYRTILSLNNLSLLDSSPMLMCTALDQLMEVS